jgi:hypothetical protein
VRNLTRLLSGLLSGLTLGILITFAVDAVAQSTKQGCSSPDLSRLYKRLDDLEQAIAALQTQSAKAASDNALANTNSQRQLGNISSQVADLNTRVVALTGTVRTLPPPPSR